MSSIGTEPTREDATNIFVGVVALAAVGALALAWAVGPAADVDGQWAALGLLTLLVCVFESTPVTVARSAGIQGIIVSTTFVFAILAMFGPLPAIIAQALASIISDVRERRGVVKTLFNVAQHTLAWALAGVAFCGILGDQALSASSEFTWRWAVAMVVAGAVYFIVNNTIVAAIVTISGALPLATNVREMIVEEIPSDIVLLALAPIVVLAVDRSLILLPVLILPVIAVYRSARLSAEKEHQALHDGLTDLPNRLQFASIMERRFDHGRNRSATGAVLLIDLDRFKEINDTLGHGAGDSLLCLIGPRIRTALPAGGVIARLGGDEFAVLLPNVDVAQATAFGRGIVQSLLEPFRLDGFNLEVEASIGVAMFPEHGTTADQLIKQADIAMYVAKGRQSGVEVYDAEQDQNSRRRLSLLSELRSAIGCGQVVLYYQPKLDLTTDQVTGFEALVRWHHPNFGLISPEEFVPFAEHTGLIKPLTSFVIRTAVAQAKTWLAEGADIDIAVNLSARSLHDGAITDEVAKILDELDLPAHRLRLEITESSIMADPARAKRVLAQLDAMGVKLAIDDFGTGYSSLAYLQSLPVREVKIDRSFVLRVLDSPRDRVIIRSTIDLTRHLGLRSTAEGIENGEAQRWLRAAGCDQGQGFHIASPMPAPEAGEWLRRRLARAAAAVAG
jgi:diguanylate cyclase (GGDEF)-like protein